MESVIYEKIKPCLSSFSSKIGQGLLANAADVNGIQRSIRDLLDIIDKDFQLKSTYSKPIDRCSQDSMADVDFYLVGQNLEYCLSYIIRHYKLKSFAYENWDEKKKPYKTLGAHLLLLDELRKVGCCDMGECRNIGNHIRNYRNALSHDSVDPGSDVRRNYIKQTLAALVLIVYFIQRYKNRKPQPASKPQTPSSGGIDVQGILDGLI